MFVGYNKPMGQFTQLTLKPNPMSKTRLIERWHK